MYIPAKHRETRLDVLHALIAAHPLGTLVTLGADGLAADHIPFEIGAATLDAPHGVLRGHVARANPAWRLAGTPVLVAFQGPSSYVSPAHFAEKAISGKVVPTWNYAAVHARGVLRTIDDPLALLALLTRLTDRHEATRAAPWAVADAPPECIDALRRAIVGIEIPITHIEGKWKINQDDSAADRTRIAAGLLGEAAHADMGALMQAHADESALMQARMPMEAR